MTNSRSGGWRPTSRWSRASPFHRREVLLRVVDERHLPLLADQRYGHGPIVGQPDVHELRRLGPLDAQVVALHVDGHHGHPTAILLPGLELPLQLDEDPGLHLLVVRLAV